MAAEYALDALLRPLQIAPSFVHPDELPSDHPSLVYGDLHDPPSAAIALSYAQEAPTYFSRSPTVLPEPVEEDAHPALFTDDLGAVDVVASTFFWLSGWQEYVVRERDEHGRFTYASSLQRRIGTASVPYVDAYRRQLQRELERAGIACAPMPWNGRTWAFCPTHDVDYVRKWRPGIIRRELMAGMKDSRRLGPVFSQLRNGDPFAQSLSQMMELVSSHGGRATWLLKGGGMGSRDVRYSLNSNLIREFVASALREGFDLGLHPSYHASTNRGQLARERERISKLTGVLPTSVRSHYLRFSLPDTIRLYEEAGLYVDSTLAFPDQEGFRFATSHPFRLFDVPRNRPTNVLEIPLTFMDASLFNRRQYSVDEAVEACLTLLETCREYGGVCVGLWHNVLADELDYPGWGRHFKDVLSEADRGGAFIGSMRDIAAIAVGTD